MLTADEVRDLMNYDPATGLFSYRKRQGYRSAGAICGKKSAFGYLIITIRKRTYQAHRIAWLYVHGEWPTGPVDHINLDKLDNRIGNLRAATPTLNNANQARSSRNSSGFKGVTWHKRCSKWQASIKMHGKNYHLGLFTEAEDAHRAYADAAKRLFGTFARAA